MDRHWFLKASIESRRCRVVISALLFFIGIYFGCAASSFFWRKECEQIQGQLDSATWEQRQRARMDDFEREVRRG